MEPLSLVRDAVSRDPVGRRVELDPYAESLIRELADAADGGWGPQ